MEQDSYPDAGREALGDGMSRVVQVASSVVTAAQVLVYLSRDYVNARRENGPARALALIARQRAERTAAGAVLDAAREPGWLDNADLNRAIEAWAAIMPYADWSLPWHHHSAATAMRQAEERLRVLHPAAMARYDQLRSEGADPAGAMLQAVPLFGHPPAAHGAAPAPLPRSLAIGGTVTPPQPGPARAGAGDAAAARPCEQDFPQRIGDVLAAAAGKDTAAPALAKPKVPAPGTSRAPRNGPPVMRAPGRQEPLSGLPQSAPARPAGQRRTAARRK